MTRTDGYSRHMPNTLDELAARMPGVLVALDFDGPIAPIVNDPQNSRPVPRAISTLSSLARKGAQIAVVTGRDVRTVLELGQLQNIPGVIVSGVHGAETWQDGELTSQPEPRGLSVLRKELPRLLSSVDPGLWLEDKRLSLVVHLQRVVDPVKILDIISGPVEELVRRAGLEVHGGKSVLEIRIPGLSKADAMDALLRVGPTAALFAGDDLGDLPAFTALHHWSARINRPGVAVSVGDQPEVRRAGDLHVETAYGMVELLTGMLN